LSQRTMTKAKKKIILKKLASHNTIWHPESRLVFKSKKEQVVVGRLDESDEIVVEEDILDVCNTWKFKIDPTLLESDSDDDVEVKEDDEEQQKTDSPKSDPAPEPDLLETKNLRDEPKSPKKSKKSKNEDTKEKMPTLVLGGSLSLHELTEVIHSQFAELETKLHEKSVELDECVAELEKEQKEKKRLQDKLAQIREHFM
nr:hypothetical protein [Gammaproteobacteria bacterium]